MIKPLLIGIIILFGFCFDVKSQILEADPMTSDTCIVFVDSDSILSNDTLIIAVRILLDSSGQVIKATLLPEKSDVVSEELAQKAINSAYKIRFAEAREPKQSAIIFFKMLKE